MFDGLRKRLHLDKHDHPIDRLTEAAALLSGVALYPQVFKIVTTRHVADLAPTTFFIMVITNTIWIAYGIHRKSIPLLISSTMNLVAASLIVVFFFVFGNGA
ncbi:PQ-loop domain-containing transporter [Patescibacteria group bacterium]|jgi:MtN3 and saliva related transmembrane protein|nr:PQ-loop domain-containing transporter [Patescibacteria group bacterium]